MKRFNGTGNLNLAINKALMTLMDGAYQLGGECVCVRACV